MKIKFDNKNPLAFKYTIRRRLIYAKLAERERENRERLNRIESTNDLNNPRINHRQRYECMIYHHINLMIFFL